MNNECTHGEYYEQFAHIFHDYLTSIKTLEEWTTLYNEDKHLNNVPLSFWDNVSVRYKMEIVSVNKKINNSPTWSFSNGVCGAKRAVELYVLNGKKE